MTTAKKMSIKALNKIDLETFLRGIGLLEAFASGELACCQCNATITRDNIGFIFPIHEKILVCCNNAECLYAASRLKAGNRE